MKRLYLCLFVALLATSLFAQSDFFYSKDGKKEVFKIRKDLVVIKTKSQDLQDRAIRQFKFESLDRLSDGWVKAKVDPNRFRDEELMRSDRVEDVYYMLEYNNTAQLALSNSIFVKPREGETIENVIRKSGLSGKIRKNELILPASGISLLTLDCKMKDILWALSLSTTKLLSRSLTPELLSDGIRSLIGFGTVTTARVHSVLYPQH